MKSSSRRAATTKHCSNQACPSHLTTLVLQYQHNTPTRRPRPRLLIPSPMLLPHQTSAIPPTFPLRTTMYALLAPRVIATILPTSPRTPPLCPPLELHSTSLAAHLPHSRDHSNLSLPIIKSPISTTPTLRTTTITTHKGHKSSLQNRTTPPPTNTSPYHQHNRRPPATPPIPGAAAAAFRLPAHPPQHQDTSLTSALQARYTRLPAPRVRYRECRRLRRPLGAPRRQPRTRAWDRHRRRARRISRAMVGIITFLPPRWGTRFIPRRRRCWAWEEARAGRRMMMRRIIIDKMRWDGMGLSSATSEVRDVQRMAMTVRVRVEV